MRKVLSFFCAAAIAVASVFSSPAQASSEALAIESDVQPQVQQIEHAPVMTEVVIIDGDVVTVTEAEIIECVLPDNGVDEATILTDWATEWGGLLATIIGLAFAFTIAYMVWRRARNKG